MGTDPGRRRPEVRVDPEEWTREPRHGRFYMSAGISILGLIAAFYVILLGNNYPPDTLKWAFGFVGLIVGYWLHNK